MRQIATSLMVNQLCATCKRIITKIVKMEIELLKNPMKISQNELIQLDISISAFSIFYIRSAKYFFYERVLHE